MESNNVHISRQHHIDDELLRSEGAKESKLESNKVLLEKAHLAKSLLLF